MYEVIVDGKSEKVENTNPLSYNNVTVWAARAGKMYPYPTANAKIQNLLIKQNGINGYLCC